MYNFDTLDRGATARLVEALEGFANDLANGKRLDAEESAWVQDVTHVVTALILVQNGNLAQYQGAMMYASMDGNARERFLVAPPEQFVADNVERKYEQEVEGLRETMRGFAEFIANGGAGISSDDDDLPY